MKKLKIQILFLTLFLLLTLSGIAYSQDLVTIYVNGKKIESDVPPQIINGRTMVPVRFVSEALGADVDWNAENRAVIITKNETMDLVTYKEKVVKCISDINFSYNTEVSSSFQKRYEKSLHNSNIILSKINEFNLITPPKELNMFHNKLIHCLYTAYYSHYFSLLGSKEYLQGNYEKSKIFLQSSIEMTNKTLELQNEAVQMLTHLRNN